MSRKLLVTDSHGDRELLLVGRMVVGRDPACDVSDADPLLSRRHAEFVVGTRDVLVRDLGSRNGILVNGIKVGESTLRPDDVVQIGHLRLRYVEDGAPLAAAPDTGVEDVDATAVIPRTASQSAAAVSMPGPPHSALDVDAAVDDDKTRLLPARGGSPSREQRPQAAAVPRAPAAPASPPREDDDKTRMVAPPAPAAAPSAPRARPVVAEASVPQPAALREEGEHAESKAHVSRQSWTLFLNVHVAALAAGVFVATAVALTYWRSAAIDAAAAAHASALVDWLAADAAAALQTGRPVAAAADAVAKEPGVVSAYILASNGRVLAPASQADQNIATIPGIAAKPADVQRLQTAQNGDVVEAARPVQQTRDQQGAVAWVTIRPVVSDSPGGAVIIAFPLILAIVFTYFAGARIGRRTMRSLQALTEDVDLAVGGKIDAVGDPVGAKPVQELARAINFLVARVRATGGGPAAASDRRDAAPSTAASRGRAAAASPTPALATGGPPAAAPRSAAPEARIRVGADLKVIDGSGALAELLGARPDALIGEHLIDVIPDVEVGDAVMRCLGALTAGGEQQTSVTSPGKSYRLSISMTRAAKDQPVTITFRAEEGK